MVGEIYVRSDPAANGRAADELERRGLRVRIEPLVEYMQFAELVQARRGLRNGLRGALITRVRARIVDAIQGAAAREMGWPRHPSVRELARTGSEWLRLDLEHEAVIALGLAARGWRAREFDGLLSVGPLECMPNKLVEAQLFHLGGREGLASLSLSLNGDPIDPEVLDQFAFEVKERFRRRAGARTAGRA